jgi:hypothetical protein
LGDKGGRIRLESSRVETRLPIHFFGKSISQFLGHLKYERFPFAELLQQTQIHHIQQIRSGCLVGDLMGVLMLEGVYSRFPSRSI